MPSHQNNSVQTYSGQFDKIKLAFIPDEPLTERERYKHKANYPTTQARLLIYLDGEEVTQCVPPGYMLFILIHLLDGVSDLMSGKSITAPWFNTAWQLDVLGYPSQDYVLITLHIPKNVTVIKNARVPMRQFCKEVVLLGKDWRKYMNKVFSDEISNKILNKQYIQFEKYLQETEQKVK